MVMPLHGQGIDLYEFVEKGAKIDEPLASYIFRQVRNLMDHQKIFSDILGGRCSELFASKSYCSSRYQR